MNIAIIGGGITGLTAAYELGKSGHKVTVFERAPILGGLAYGFREKNWAWHLEFAYHHLFTNDQTILRLLHELGLGGKILIKRPVTANLIPNSSVVPAKAGIQTGSPIRSGMTNNLIVQLDSPLHLLKFPGLSLFDKFRTATLLAFLKLNPFWQPLEKITAEQLLCAIGGKRAYAVLWEPLLVGKFGTLAPTISAAWFWARIKKRTPRLAYIAGGFHTLVTALETAIKKHGGKIYTSASVENIKNVSGAKYKIQNTIYDKVLLTTPTPIATRLMKFPKSFIDPLLTIPHLTAQTLILETDKPILKNTYWLNVTDRSFPFLAAVAHTNYMDKKNYGGHHLTYFGNYLPNDHKYLSMSKQQLLKEFTPFINRLSQKYSAQGGPASGWKILNTYMFVAPYAQPVHQKNYSSRAPKLITPLPGVYLANMDSIFPWDRGTNYAVELGQKAATAIENSK